MIYIINFFKFWFRFIIGDDWLIAASVFIGLGLTNVLIRHGYTHLWWLLPLFVITMLTLSLWFASRRK
jgi:hypothetical protein